MNHLLYQLLLFSLLLAHGRGFLDTSRDGCNRETWMCRYDIYCHKTIDISFYQNFGRDHGCSDYVSYRGNSFNLIYLTVRNYKEYNSDGSEKLLLSDMEGSANIVYSLDLSNNEYSTPPMFTTMSNLRTLNLSRNVLSEAKLSNQYELEALQEIDYSYNTINSIVVNSYEIPYRKLRKINLSNNYIVKIEESVFDSFTELEELDLSYNFIDYMNILTFEGTKNLLILNLKHNRLSNLDFSLLRFTKLTNLDLSENKIQTLKQSDFEKLNNLKSLSLQSNVIKIIEEFVFHHMKQLENVDLSNNEIEILNKNVFVNASSLKIVDLSKNHIKLLPKELFKDKNVIQFLITQNQLEGSLTKGVFEGLRLITELDLSNQMLTSIEDYAFFGLENIKTLLINNNFLQSLSKNSFSSLRNLETLDLSNNQLTDISFDKSDLISLRSLMLQKNSLTQITHKYFDGLNMLQFLDLSNNNITQLESNSFMSLRDLVNFQISNNPISGSLEKGSFDGLNSLPSLDFSSTLVTSIKNGSFSGMNQLKYLNISHSKISELQFNSFLNTGLIETVDLSHNELKDFNINTTELVSLNILILNNNLLKTISSDTFKGLLRLTKITVSDNKIESVADDAFSSQKDIRNLDLSYNENLKFNVARLGEARNLISLSLSGVQTNTSFRSLKDSHLSLLEMSRANICNITNLNLNKLSMLDSLVLSNNNVTSLDSSAMSGLKSLRKLDLSFNKITFIQPGAFKDNILMQHLNISHNLLTAVSYGIFRGLVYLNTIDMSYNEITDLQSERFYEVHSLNVLIVDHNRISNINGEEFGGTLLHTLSIGENPMPCDVLVNLKKSSPSFEITAIRLENGNENVDGVTCNMNHYKKDKHISRKEHNENDNILIDIRDILHNISLLKHNEPTEEATTNYTKYFKDINNEIEKLNSNMSSSANISNYFLDKLSASLNIGNTNINILLNKIVKLIAGFNASKQGESVPVVKGNVTAAELIPYINKIKQDLEFYIAEEKKNILIEVENKISVMNSRKETNNVSAIFATHEAYSTDEGSMSKSLIFLETCVALILVILVVFILYKIRNSGVFVPSRSMSTRNLPDSMENSTL